MGRECFAPTETFDPGASERTAVAALACGLILTISIVGYLWFSLRRTRQLEKLTISLP